MVRAETSVIMEDSKGLSICVFHQLYSNGLLATSSTPKTTQREPQTSILSLYLVIESDLVVEDNSVGLFGRWPWQRETAARWAHLVHYGNNGRRCEGTQTHTCTEVHRSAYRRNTHKYERIHCNVTCFKRLFTPGGGNVSLWKLRKTNYNTCLWWRTRVMR